MKRAMLLHKVAVFFIGLFLALLVMEVSLRVIAKTAGISNRQVDNYAVSGDGVLRILCLGESTTALGGEYSYPSQLEHILRKRLPGTMFKVINEGYPGINTSVILSQAEANLNKYKPDFVITMMGANDGVPYLSYRDSWLGAIPVLRDSRVLRLLNNIYPVCVYKTAEFMADSIFHFPYLYIISAKYCLSKGMVVEAERILKKAVANFPNDPLVYTALGRYYGMRNLDFDKAIKMYVMAIAKGANDAMHYKLLGRVYYNSGSMQEAIKNFREAVKLNPGDALGYVDLAKALYITGKKTEAEELFQKAITLASGKPEVYFDIGNFLVFQAYKFDDTATKKIEQVKWFFEESIKNDHRNWNAYNILAMYYYKAKQYDKAESMYKEIIKINPNVDVAYSGLSRIYADTERLQLSDEYNNKANEVRLNKYNPIMRYNYLRLRDMLAGRGIRWIVVQYPLRAVQQLKNILGEGNLNMIYVDNEDIFRTAVDKEGYDYYFVDAGAGDFGHCTPKGNKILAENIAKTIISKWFKPQGS